MRSLVLTEQKLCQTGRRNFLQSQMMSLNHSMTKSKYLFNPIKWTLDWILCAQRYKLEIIWTQILFILSTMILDIIRACMVLRGN